MGTYITPAELKARYKAFETKKNFNVSSDAIYYAEKEVEAGLAPAYSVPFSASHPTVKDLCIDMVYARYLRTNEPKKGMQIYKMVKERIKGIVNGDEPIITGSGYLDPVSSGADLPGSTTEDYHPTHSMLGAENEYSYISSERMSDLEAARD